MTFFSPFVALAGLGSSSVVVNFHTVQLVASGLDSPRAPLLDYSLRGCPVEHLGFTGLGCTFGLTNGGCSNGIQTARCALTNLEDAAACTCMCSGKARVQSGTTQLHTIYTDASSDIGFAHASPAAAPRKSQVNG